MNGLKVHCFLIGIVIFVKGDENLSSLDATTIASPKDIELPSTESSIKDDNAGKSENLGKKMNEVENVLDIESEEEIMNQDDSNYDGKINNEGESEDIPGPNFLFGVEADKIPPELRSMLSRKMENKTLQPQEESYKNTLRQFEIPDKKWGGSAPHDNFDTLTHNCTVINSDRSAEISIPQLNQRYETVRLKVKKIVQREYCYQSVKTVCTETQKHVENKVCKFTYETERKEAVINSVKVDYKKKSDTKWVTVCKHTYTQKLGYDNGYGKPVCKEVSQRIAFNSPILKPDNIPVIVSYPVPIKKCVNKPILLPSINCNTKTEKKCIHVPDIEEEIREIKICHYSLDKPKLTPVVLSLPQQVCAEIVKAY